MIIILIFTLRTSCTALWLLVMVLYLAKTMYGIYCIKGCSDRRCCINFLPDRNCYEKRRAIRNVIVRLFLAYQFFPLLELRSVTGAAGKSFMAFEKYPPLLSCPFKNAASLSISPSTNSLPRIL